MIANTEYKESKWEPVFEAKERQNFIIRVLEQLIAICATIVLWMFLLVAFYNKIYVETNASLEHVGEILLTSFILTVALLGGWQFYNWFRFHNKGRRKEFKPQSLEEVGMLYGISLGNMERLQEIRNVAVVEFKNHCYYYCIDGQNPIEIGMLRKK